MCGGKIEKAVKRNRQESIIQNLVDHDKGGMMKMGKEKKRK